VKETVKEALKSPVADGTVSLCLDMYTDDYRKKLANYKAMRVPPACSNPLEFWKEHAIRPTL